MYVLLAFTNELSTYRNDADMIQVSCRHDADMMQISYRYASHNQMIFLQIDDTDRGILDFPAFLQLIEQKLSEVKSFSFP